MLSTNVSVSEMRWLKPIPLILFDAVKQMLANVNGGILML